MVIRSAKTWSGAMVAPSATIGSLVNVASLAGRQVVFAREFGQFCWLYMGLTLRTWAYYGHIQ
jgi:hypothetical protein